MSRWPPGKKFPPLDHLTGTKKAKPQGQSPEQMMAVARMLTVMHGGTVTQRKPE